MLVLSRGWTSADTSRLHMLRQVTATDRKVIWPEARRITRYGWVMVAVLVAAPALTFALLVTRHLPMLPSALLFLGGAAVGWLVVAGIFRFRGVGQVVLWILLVGLPPIVALQSLRATLGFAFGTALAWLPHCWRLVGVSSTRS
jgi:hypothetical protein